MPTYERSSGTGPTRVGMTALCGGALALNLLLVAGLLVIVGINGVGHFWQHRLLHVVLDDGTRLLGEPSGTEWAPRGEGEAATRWVRLKVSQPRGHGVEIVRIAASRIVSRDYPTDAVVVDRLDGGPLFGTMVELRRNEETLAVGSDEVWQAFGPLLDRKLADLAAVRRLERREIGDVVLRLEKLSRARRALALAGPGDADRSRRAEELARRMARLQSERDALERRLAPMREQLLAEKLVVETAEGRRVKVAVGRIVSALRPNRMGPLDRPFLCVSRMWDFVVGEPRAAGAAGGIFPAIVGTVLLVFIVAGAGAPLGVLAALYLGEYARRGWFARVVRLAVHNLAGVPSVVVGVFGLAFFVVLLGGTIDRLFYRGSLPEPTFGTGGVLWAGLTLALVTVPVVIVATEEGLAAVPRIAREGSLALGATRFETTWRMVLPAAAPGILSGLALCVARTAGAVAPLLIVGAVGLAPVLPLDHNAPYVHLERKFMHLGSHIYEVGFAGSQGGADVSIVYATVLSLIGVVAVMHLIAVGARNYLRRRYASDPG
jgi:phosphate transport system permease protein